MHPSNKRERIPTNAQPNLTHSHKNSPRMRCSDQDQESTACHRSKSRVRLVGLVCGAAEWTPALLLWRCEWVVWTAAEVWLSKPGGVSGKAELAVCEGVSFGTFVYV